MPTPENPEEVLSEAAEAEPEAAADETAAAEGDAPAPEEAPSDQVAELTADLQRVSAEYANYRKRTAKDVFEARSAGKAAAVAELLAVVDDLDRARAHGDLESGPLKSVSDKLNSVLAGLGLESFGAEGDPFDPAVHEAVQHEGDGADPVLGAVLRQGYRVDGRVIRHAMVAVVDGPSEPAGDGADQDES